MVTDAEIIKKICEMAYGDLAEAMFNKFIESQKAKETEKQETVKETSGIEQTVSEITPAAIEKDTPIAEQFMPEVKDEKTDDKPHLVTPESKAKDEYPGLFGLFTEMLGGNDNGSGTTDEIFAEMFAMAFASMTGVDVFKERLDERERQLQEELEKERQARLAAEQALAEERAGKEASQSEHMPIEPVNVSEAKIDVSKVKVKTQAEIAYEQMSGGKEQVTLADLEKAGVNLKADLQPTLKALTKDNPAKLGELAPQGLGDKDKPVSKEFAVALIGRKQQRDAIAKHNMNMRA